MNNLFINLVFCLIFTVMFFASPESYSFYFCMFLLLLYILQNIIFFRNEDGGLNFGVVFSIAFLLCNLVYPVFYYTDNPYVSMFSFGYNERVISKATALAVLGYSFYILGTTSYRKNFNKQVNFNDISIDHFSYYVIFSYSIRI